MLGMIGLLLVIHAGPQAKAEGCRPDTAELQRRIKRTSFPNQKLLYGGPQAVFLEGAGLELRSFDGTFSPETPWTPTHERDACFGTETSAGVSIEGNCHARTGGTWQCDAKSSNGGRCGAKQGALFTVIVVNGH